MDCSVLRWRFDSDPAGTASLKFHLWLWSWQPPQSINRQSCGWLGNNTLPGIIIFKWINNSSYLPDLISITFLSRRKKVGIFCMMQHAANYIDKATSQGQALTSVVEGFLAVFSPSPALPYTSLIISLHRFKYENCKEILNLKFSPNVVSVFKETCFCRSIARTKVNFPLHPRIFGKWFKLKKLTLLTYLVSSALNGVTFLSLLKS